MLPTLSTSPLFCPQCPSAHLCPRKEDVLKDIVPSFLSLLLSSQDNPKPNKEERAANHPHRTGFEHLKLGRCSKHCEITQSARPEEVAAFYVREAAEFIQGHDGDHNSPYQVRAYTKSAATVVPDQSIWSISSINLREET